jgi:phospholipid-binding lipoprotein MlaA
MCVKTELVTKKCLMIALLAFCLLGSSCKPATDLSNNDPLESFNRTVFSFNDALDQGVFRPTALAYRKTIPTPIRSSIDNFLNWLNGPTIITNSIMQGDLVAAKNSSTRFFMNTTSLGLIDAAADFGIKHRSEDFGQTLGIYGVSSGPYVVLPLLGPTNVRDIIGRVVDNFLNPLAYIGTLNNRLPYTVSKNILSAVNFRSENFDQIDDLRTNSLDAYAKVRTIYGQRRRAAINNGEVPINISTQDPSKAFEEYDAFAFDEKTKKTAQVTTQKKLLK